jgi:hypothetical protein
MSSLYVVRMKIDNPETEGKFDNLVGGYNLSKFVQLAVEAYLLTPEGGKVYNALSGTIEKKRIRGRRAEFVAVEGEKRPSQVKIVPKVSGPPEEGRDGNQPTPENVITIDKRRETAVDGLTPTDIVLSRIFQKKES